MRRVMMAAMAFGLVAGLSFPALATELSYGIVDINKVVQTADAAKGIFSELEGKRKEYQSQISKEEDSLRSFETDVMKQKDTLSKEEFEKKRKEFEGKMTSAQKMVQERKRLLDQAFSEAMGAFRKEVLKATADIAKEKGYAAVFTQEALVLAEPGLDITTEVISRVNKSVKKIPVVWDSKKK